MPDNGIVEPGHRTLVDAHFRADGRRTSFGTIAEMQSVLGQYLVEHNAKRPHQGRGMNGRTPITAFIDGIRKEIPRNNPNPESRLTHDQHGGTVSRLTSLYILAGPISPNEFLIVDQFAYYAFT